MDDSTSFMDADDERSEELNDETFSNQNTLYLGGSEV